MSRSNIANSFPASYWDPGFHLYLGMTRFLEDPSWRRTKLKPPPSSSGEIRRELESLLKKQSNGKKRAARVPEILEEASAITPKFKRVLLMNERSHPKTHELMLAMVQTGRPIVMHFKNRFNRARPSQLEPRLRPIIDSPGHPAYPSGHSTQMHLIAHALSELVPHAREQLFEIAGRVAENREWAGIHYESDSEAGVFLAQKVFPQLTKAFAEEFEHARKEW